MLSGCQFEQQKASITIEMSIDNNKMSNTYQDQLRTIPNLITLHNNVTNKTYYVSSKCLISQTKCTVSENVTFPATYDINVSSVEGYDQLISWNVMDHSGKVVAAANAPNAAPYDGTFSL